MKYKSALLLATAMLCACAAFGRNIPERAVIVSGDTTNADHIDNIAVMYSRLNRAFSDPDAPRFLFLDKQGKVALGIGGYVKATGMYDFGGAVDANDFVTNMIPVPGVPDQRDRFGATASHSTIFLKLVSRPTKLGRIIVYIQTNFTGDNGGYGLKLDQAYMSVGNMTFGLARTTFADAPAMAPTVDDQGPSGQVSKKNMLIRYQTPSYKGLSGAVSVEVPSASYTLAPGTKSISQRFPDIPAYIQYAWAGEESHVRLSGILREMSYRDEINGTNKFATGWGVQLSAITGIVGGLKFFGHYTYGKGIASYINDLAGEGYNLIPDGNGKLKAPGMAGWTAGLQYNFTPGFFISASYSQALLYDNSKLESTSYDRGQYLAVNGFYNIIPDLRVGVEYLHGALRDVDGLTGKANRIEAMVQYSF